MQSSWNTYSAEQTMARVLPYITFIVFLLVLSAAAQAGLGRTPDNEGKDAFLLLSICNSVYFFITSIHSISNWWKNGYITSV